MTSTKELMFSVGGFLKKNSFTPILLELLLPLATWCSQSNMNYKFILSNN